MKAKNKDLNIEYVYDKMLWMIDVNETDPMFFEGRNDKIIELKNYVILVKLFDYFLEHEIFRKIPSYVVTDTDYKMRVDYTSQDIGWHLKAFYEVISYPYEKRVAFNKVLNFVQKPRGGLYLHYLNKISLGIKPV